MNTLKLIGVFVIGLNFTAMAQTTVNIHKEVPFEWKSLSEDSYLNCRNIQLIEGNESWSMGTSF